MAYGPSHHSQTLCQGNERWILMTLKLHKSVNEAPLEGKKENCAFKWWLWVILALRNILSLLINIFGFKMAFSNGVFVWCWPPSNHTGSHHWFQGKKSWPAKATLKDIREISSTTALLLFSQNIRAAPRRSLSQEMLPCWIPNPPSTWTFLVKSNWRNNLL